MKWRRPGPRALVLAFLALTSKTARAEDELPVRQASLAFDEKQTLRVSVGYRDVVDAAMVAKLMGGLPTTIVMRAYVFRETGRGSTGGSVQDMPGHLRSLGRGVPHRNRTDRRRPTWSPPRPRWRACCGAARKPIGSRSSGAACSPRMPPITWPESWK